MNKYENQNYKALSINVIRVVLYNREKIKKSTVESFRGGNFKYFGFY